MAQTKVNGIENNALHEVAPVDVRPTPEISETGSVPVAVHDPRQIEPEEK